MEPGDFEIFPSPKRVRVVLGGEVIADSTRVLLLRAERLPPVYYFRPEDLRAGVLDATGHTRRIPGLGEARRCHVRTAHAQRTEAGWVLERVEPGLEPLLGCVGFDWNAMDGWFEEDLEVFVHPRDPRKRVDIAPSSRWVEVKLDGTTIACSERAWLLFETGLPVRYYLPKLDCRLDLLEPGTSMTHCPYKGEARYYSIQLGERREENVAWYYRFPTVESAAIATAVAFYQERVEVYVDGERV